MAQQASTGSAQDYARIPFTALMAVDKRVSTHVLSSAREGILRGGKHPKSSVLQSPFRAAQTVNPDASAPLPEIQNFPIGISENTGASIQVSNSFDNVLGQDHLTHAGSNAGIEIMI